jgi:two-component system NarL family sensor kinase
VTHPSVLDRIGLAAALQAVADYHGARVGIDVSLKVDPANTTRYDRLFFSTARELLINVVKHARASRALVEVSMEGHYLRLSVVDDGIGWELQSIGSLVEQGHFGLAAVADRVESVGGTIQVRRREHGSGTVAVVDVPLGPPPGGSLAELPET